MLGVVFLFIFSGYVVFHDLSLLTKGSFIPDVPDFWPELDGDLTKVVWSHATNSVEKLQEALIGDTMMLEADVSLGTLIGQSGEDPYPIMAHPPETTSDLSLEMFLEGVLQAVASGVVRKGIKLDFKSIEVVEKSLQLIQEKGDKLNFPLWLNADIILGPHAEGQQMRKPVDPDQFLILCNKYFPDAAISPGFTTGVPEDPENRKYTQEQVQQMFQVLDKNQFVGKKITFPVRAVLVGKSLEVLTWLLDQTSTKEVLSTLTIWGDDDMTTEEKQKLFEVVNLIGRNRIYWDTGFPLEDQ